MIGCVAGKTSAVLLRRRCESGSCDDKTDLPGLDVVDRTRTKVHIVLDPAQCNKNWVSFGTCN